MVLQVKDADGQGEIWDSADGTRWGTRGLRQRQLPLCPSLLRVPLQACHPWYRGGRVEAPCPPANRSQLGWGAPEVQRWVTPKFLQVGSVRDSFPPICLWEAGRTPPQPPSSSRPLPTPPHLPWDGKGSGLTTSAHLIRRQYQSQNPRRLEHLFWLELWFRHWSLLCGTESK